MAMRNGNPMIERHGDAVHRSVAPSTRLPIHPRRPSLTGSDFPALQQSFFCRPAEVVGPDLVGCRLVKRLDHGSLLWGVVVETEAYSQTDPACHGYRRRSPQNETLFGEPGRFYVYVSYGIHHCVKRAVTQKSSGGA